MPENMDQNNFECGDFLRSNDVEEKEDEEIANS